MENLTKQERVQLKKILLARDQTLREEIRREISMQNECAEVASEVPDSGDLAFANLSMDIGNAAVARDAHELRAISYALKRLEGESYGECLSRHEYVIAKVMSDSFWCEGWLNVIGNILLQCAILGQCVAKSPSQ